MVPTIGLCVATLACERGTGGPEAPWLSVPSRASHDAFFPIAAGPHAADCSSCHGGGDSFKQFDCLTCHTAAPTADAHTGVTGFAYASPSCLSCHPRGTSDFNHVAFPVAGPDTHALGKQVATAAGAQQIVCASCHQDPASRQSVTCTGCHTSAGANAAGPAPVDLTPAHARVAGSSWKAAGTPTPQCLLCHAGDLNERVDLHGAGRSPPFSSDHPGVTFSIAAGDHLQACDKCHTAQLAAGPTFKNPRIDFDQRSCDGCHTEAKEKLVSIHKSVGLTIADPVGPNNAAACLACHPDGSAAPSTTPGYSHPFFPVGAGSAHEPGKPAIHAGGTFQCTTCHTALTTDASKIDCTGCHSQQELTTSAGASVHAAVPDVTWPTPATPHPTSLACLACHADAKVPAQVSVSTSSNKGKHDASNPAILFAITAGSPHDTSRTDRAMACRTCHPVASAPFAAVPAEVVTDFAQQTCTACHLSSGTLHQDLNQLHLGVTSPAPGFTPVPTTVTPAYSKTCLLCHALGQVDPVLAAQNHAASFPITSADSHTYGKVVTVRGVATPISCSACHVDQATRSNVDCTGCHLQTAGGAAGPNPSADLTTAHAGKVGTTGVNGAPHNLWLGSGPVGSGGGASAKCVLCHSADAHRAGTVANHGKASAATGNAVFDIGAGNANHFVSCDQCHTATTTSAGRLNPEQDFTRASCDACHAATGASSIAAEHAGFGQPLTRPFNAGDPNNSLSCLTCHPTGGAANFDHVWFPIAAGEKHSSAVAKCADCHSTAASYSGDPAANLPLITCTKCHDDTAANKPNQGGVTTTAAHQSARVGKDIWDVPGGLDYGTNALCLKCHAGNINDPAIAAFSSKLVFRLSQHDAHCLLRGKNLLSGDSTHNVNGNNDTANPTLPRCFACHDSLATGTATPWATDWKIGRQSPPPPAQGCKNCHEHLQGGGNSAPTVVCQ